MGVFCDATAKLWSRTRWRDNHEDLQYTTFLFLLQAIFFYLLAASIRVSNVWFFLLMPSIGASFFKCVFYTNINYCYSINVRGMTIAMSNILTLSILWTQQYIIEAVQVNQDFDAYLYAQIGLSTFVFLLLLPIPFLRIFGLDPIWLRKLDQIRIDEKDTGTITRPCRVSAAIDYHRVTTADNFASRKTTALEFRQSVMQTFKHRKISTLKS